MDDNAAGKCANIKCYFQSRNLGNPLGVWYSKMLSALLLKDEVKIQAEKVYINTVSG